MKNINIADMRVAEAVAQYIIKIADENLEVTDNNIRGALVAIETLRDSSGKNVDRDIEILKLLADSSATLAGVGRKYGLSGSRIKEIELKLLRKLRVPYRVNLVLNGVSTHYITYEKNIYEAAKRVGIEMKYIDKNDNTTADIRSISIDNLGLSSRAWNSLYREKLLTVGQVLDLINSNENWHMKVKNLGLKSKQEIESKIASIEMQAPTKKLASYSVSIERDTKGKNLVVVTDAFGKQLVKTESVNVASDLINKCILDKVRELNKNNLAQ